MPSSKPGGKEVTQVVRIDQPHCIKSWGLTDLRGQCPAFLGIHGPQKCHNTRKTCPVPLSYSAGERYLLLGGTSGQFAWTADSAAVDITGDIELIAFIRMNDFTPASEVTILGKWVSAGNQQSYALNVDTAGKLRIYWTTDGSTVQFIQSSAALTAVDGVTDLYIRAALDVDNGAAGKTASFYTSVDGKTWTALGTPQTVAGTTSIFSGSAPLNIGAIQADGSGNLWAGRVYYAAVKNALGGPDVAVFDINDATVDAAGSITSSRTGETWTVGSGVQTVVGFRDLLFVPGQSGVQKHYSNATATIQKMATAPETINLSGMDGKSEALLGQRETVTVEIRNDLSGDFLVDKYRLERLTALSATKYLSLPGSTGNYPSTPDVAANSITGDLAVRALISMDDWTPGTEATIVSKWDVTGNQRSYVLVITTDGKIRLYWSVDGTAGAIGSATSTVAITISNGQKLWVLASLDVNNGAAGNTAAFGTSTDFNPIDSTGTVTALGTSVVQGGTTSIFNGSAALAVGLHDAGASGAWAGKVWYADVAPSIVLAHTIPAAIFNPQNALPGATSIVSGVTGETWTVNQSGSPAAALIGEAAAYDSYTKGTRWGKWLARNPYHSGFNASVYDGVVGQPLREMVRRQYLLASVEGPSDKVITLTLRDFFDKISQRKAAAPFPNRGELFADMTGSPATFTLFPAGIGNEEYAASGYVCVDREIIQYTRSGDTMTVVARGALGTTQSDHKDEDLVQQVLVITSQTVKDIIYLLLVTYGRVPPSWIDSLAWSQASAALGELYSTVIPEPTAVSTLLGELAELVGVSVFPNVKTGLIDFVPLRPAAPLATIDDQGWIVNGSMKPPKRLDKRRISRCLIRYGPKDPTVSLDEANNFRSRTLVIDAASEGPTQYGTASLKEINSRWIPQFGGALALGHATRMVGMFRDPPLQAEFRVTAPRADSVGLSLASTITLKTWDSEDAYGDSAMSTHAVVRLARDPVKDEVEVRTLETKFGPGVIIDKTIFIADDTTDFNFRTAWSQLFGVPRVGDTPKCILLSGIFVGGGAAVGAYSFDVGDWPAGIVPDITIDGEILPAGGQGGDGGNVSLGTDVNDGTAGVGSGGNTGGNGFRTTIPVIVRGGGVIRSGFGGGAGGGAGIAIFATTVRFSAPGGGGAGARGFPPGNPGSGGTDVWAAGGTDDHSPNDTDAIWPAQPGEPASRFVHGVGGQPVTSGKFNTRQIKGGTGGDGMQNGSAAFDVSAQDSYDSTSFQNGGTAGTRGIAIQGNSLITFTGWTGTVDGTTTG